MRVVDAVDAVVVEANPATAITMPPPAPLAEAGEGQVEPPSVEISRYSVRLPLAPPEAKHERLKSPPSQALLTLLNADPVT